MDVSCRRVRPDDEAVFLAIYSAVRAEELQLDGLPADVRDPVLQTQFEAQRRAYRVDFPAADECLILGDGLPIGWIIVDRTAGSLHGIDIGLLRAERSKGVGTRLIQQLQEEAAAGGRPMVITVQRLNRRAASLYERLGFQVTKETPVHLTMEWRQA